MVIAPPPRSARRPGLRLLSLLFVLCALTTGAPAQEQTSADARTEADLYALREIPIPEGLVLEVGGLAPVDGDRVYVCTRRGDLWAVDGASTDQPTWHLWADGLSEPLGILPDGDDLLVIQRGELTRLSDRDGDHRAERYQVVNDDWMISGNYHEYAFGPTRDADGDFWITLNKPFGDEPFGRVDWRGWAVRIPKDGGPMEPAVAGLRSPAGIGLAPWGDLFYTDNQGEWCGASKLSILIEGEFHGHPWGIDSAMRPESLVEHPGDVPDGVLMPQAARDIPGFRLPAVWFPYDVMGRSPSGFAWDTTGGAFGPFAGQLFVGDQYQASVLRVFLEEIDGTWQGACFPFRKGMASGVIRVAFDEATAELVVGSSDRGWSSLGDATYGLERLAWTGETAFEMKQVQALPEGFRLVFTTPADADSVAGLADDWTVRSFTYLYHSPYGSSEVDEQECEVSDVTLSDDGLSLELSVDGLREGYVHELRLPEPLRAADGSPPLHDLAYYTLIDRPGEWPPWEPPEESDDDDPDAD